MTDDAPPCIDHYIKAIQERKAFDIVILNVGPLSSVADTFIICSGRSSRQVEAIADHIQSQLKKRGIRPLSVEGRKTGHWVLMDYGDTVIHVFYAETREFFDLEGLWDDAQRVEVPTPDEKTDAGDGAPAEHSEED